MYWHSQGATSKTDSGETHRQRAHQLTMVQPEWHETFETMSIGNCTYVKCRRTQCRGIRDRIGISSCCARILYNVFRCTPLIQSSGCHLVVLVSLMCTPVLMFVLGCSSSRPLSLMCLSLHRCSLSVLIGFRATPHQECSAV